MSLRAILKTVALTALASICASAVFAAPPASETIFPGTTKLLVSIPDPDAAQDNFDASQLGKMFNDPKMEKFNEDMERQLEGQGRLAERLGISVAELEGVSGGEIALAVIQPNGDEDSFATAMIIDYTGHGKEITEMLGAIRDRRLALDPQAWSKVEMFGSRRGLRVHVPAAKGRPAVDTYYYFEGGLLVCCDHLAEAQAIHARITGGGSKDSLAGVPAFAHAMKEVAAASPGIQPDVRWFVEPFGYMRVRRAEQIAEGTRRPERGRDMLEVYENEGFDAIQGGGGWVNFSQDGHEVLHRTLVYAPAVDRTKKSEEVQRRLKTEKAASPAKVKYAGDENTKYFLGARMMSFMNQGGLKPLDWIPDDIATQLTFHWQMQQAFKYSETLVNALSDDKKQEVWVGVMDSIKEDRDGPMVDIRKDMAAQMGQRATIISDNVKPIDINSEREVIALQIAGDVAAVTKALDGMMADDPDAVKHEANGHTVWEIVPPPPGVRDEDERNVEPASYTVAHGHLLRGSHPDILKRLHEMPKKPLAASDDLKAVNVELDKLSDGQESFRYFDRLDRSWEVHWEMFRQNKFPQAETRLSDMVAQMQGYDLEDPATKKRKQELDGTNLPGFDFAKPFLGASGMFIKTRPDGWLVTGMVLTKE